MGVTALLSAVLLMAGCEGTESRNQVDDTVRELAGKKQVDRMKAMKQDLDQIQTRQADRIKQLETAD
jgi:outer membrane murein-binding lipoprotein Lpp